MKQMVALGHEVYAVTPKGDRVGHFETHGIHEIHYNMQRSSINPFAEIWAMASMYRTLLNLSPDLLHTFTIKPNIYGAIVGKWAKIPRIVSTITGLGSVFLDSSFKARMLRMGVARLYQWALHRTDVTIFQNQTDRDMFIQQTLIPAHKAQLIRSSGVDTSFFDPSHVDSKTRNTLKAQFKIKSNQCVVMMIARAIWHKGIAEYFNAVQRVHEQDDTVRFYLVGDTDDGNPSCVPSHIIRANPSVTWLGAREDIRELLAMSDVVVLPSYREGVPRTLLEASSMEKPMVTTQTAGCIEVVQEGINGYLVPVKDSKLLAQRILTLAQTPSMRIAMGKKAREIAVLEFDVNRVVQAYVNLYGKLLNNAVA
jgi:N,N'-diacetylbacillosaminyl-diphospho-undecaprenol alpha-1,3-N-acetylgalactosaminyltransferase